MIKIILAVVLLVGLFVVLNKAASLLLDNLQYAIKKTKTKPIIIGLILGFFTTIPELAVGFNAIYNNIGAVSLGNIWGTIIVLFTLVLGLAIIFNHGIENKGKLYFVISSFLLILLSIILAFNGSFNWINGLIVLFLYGLLIYVRFFRYKENSNILTRLHITKKKAAWSKFKEKIKYWFSNFRKEIFISLISLIIILISSFFIVDIAIYLLSYWQVSPFIIGLLIFSIGTNLPEISITIRSAYRGAGSLSFNHLVGSAINSIAALGFLSLFHNFSVDVNTSFIYFFIITCLVLLIVTIFYISRRTFDRWEGIALLGIYLLFIVFQFI